MMRIATLMARLVLILGLALAPANAHPDTFAPLVERVLPSVVNISTVPYSEYDLAEPRALGSGFIISDGGLVVTNNHVIDGEEISDIVVILHDGEQFRVNLRGIDPETDLALLEIQGAVERFKPVKFGNSDRAEVGDWVLAIGNPFGLGSSVSAGIISGESRDIGAGLYDKFLQTDAAINRGNSGGPLFDSRGRVIGVNTVIFSQSGGSVGVGFAIPSEIAERVVQQLATFGKTSRGYLGAFLEDVDPRTRTRLGLDRGEGALVTGIAVDDGPAARAGLQPGDVVMRFNGEDVDSRRGITQLIADAPVGRPLPVVYNRDGELRQVSVTLVSREQRLAAAAQGQETGEMELAGLELRTVSAAVASQYGLPKDLSGVVVTGVSHHLGISSLMPGDVILEIGWDEAETVDTVSAHLKRLRDARSGPVQILVRRGDRYFYETIRP